MKIALTRSQIDAALPKVEEGFDQYLWLQQNRDVVNIRTAVLSDVNGDGTLVTGVALGEASLAPGAIDAPNVMFRSVQ